MYEVGKVYIWQNQVGRFAYINEVECTVTGPRAQFTSAIDGRESFGWPTDLQVGGYEVAYAYVGDLRPKNPPSGERRVTDLFKLPELADA